MNKYQHNKEKTLINKHHNYDVSLTYSILEVNKNIWVIFDPEKYLVSSNKVSEPL